MADHPKDLTKRQRYWLDHIRSCETSGQSMMQYASENGLAVHALYAGKKTLVDKGVLPRSKGRHFQQVSVAHAVVEPQSQWQIQLPNGVAIAFSGLVDAGTLATVLTATTALD